MKIEDFGGVAHVNNKVELHQALLKRYGDNANELWLCGDEDQYPALAIMIRADLCCLHYFKSEDHPGLISVANGKNNLPPTGFTVFLSGGVEMEQEVPNDHVVTFDDAFNAAIEFFVKRSVPAAISWMEL